MPNGVRKNGAGHSGGVGASVVSADGGADDGADGVSTGAGAGASGVGTCGECRDENHENMFK
jgi:hypothetical protein